MTSGGIFFEYKGPIDFQIIDTLLVQLKGKNEFSALSTIIRKRTYSLFVECIENICKHSALQRSDDQKVQPHISVSNEENKITISAGNPVSEEVKIRFIKRLDNINNLDVSALRKIHETRISRETVKEANGAGLGLICMAYKSGNKLTYCFNPLIPGYLYFEMKISLNI